MNQHNTTSIDTHINVIIMNQHEISIALDPHKVARMIQACSTNNLVEINSLIEENAMYARQQDETT